jgi:uncharacterized protein YkwD
MRSARIARVVAVASALATVATRAESRSDACEALRWDLDDALRELVELRVARGRALAPADVQLALRRRNLAVVDPLFRFEPAVASPASTPAPRGGASSSFACVKARTFREGRATLRVESPVEALDADPVPEGLRVRVTFVDPAERAASVVMAGLAGPACTIPITVRGGRGEVIVPAPVDANAAAAAAVLQVVATTETGPEVVAERWLGDAAAIAASRIAADARAPRALTEGLAEERAALDVPPLAPSRALDRLAEETLAKGAARGVLAHRTEAGLVGDRMQVARIAHHGAGELLARIPAGADAASRFSASPAHRAVLGDASFTHVGTAARRGPDGLDWVVVVLARLAHETPAKDRAGSDRPVKPRGVTERALAPARSAPRRP